MREPYHKFLCRMDDVVISLDRSPPISGRNNFVGQFVGGQQSLYIRAVSLLAQQVPHPVPMNVLTFYMLVLRLELIG